MADIIRNRTISPLTRNVKSKNYKVNTTKVSAKDILIVNITHARKKTYKRTFKIPGEDVAGKKSIHFSVKEDRRGVHISWSYLKINNKSDYYTFLANQLFYQFNSIVDIKKITSNSTLIGAYSEAIIRHWLRENFFKENILTGSVISPELAIRHDNLQQMDTIIYSPSPMPAIFKAENFGIVPVYSAFGIIEIKRTDYTDAVKQIEEVLNYVKKIKKRKYTFKIKDEDGSKKNKTVNFPDSFGIVCLKENNEPKLRLLNGQNRVYYFLEKNNNGKITINAKDVLRFVNRILLIKHQLQKSFGLISVYDIDSIQS